MNLFFLVVVAVSVMGMVPGALSSATDLVITEFLASNSAGLQDEDMAYSDWIEIHNSGSVSVAMGGLFLTDKATTPTKWMFPSVSLQPNGYLVVFASSKNRVNPNSELHTNFALSASGEYLGIYAIDGITPLSEYSPAYPPQFDDISYGIDSNGDIRSFSNPSPGAANGVGDVPVAEAVTTNFDRGFYKSPFLVTLSTTQLNAQIRYTIDGSEPTANTGTAYVAPIAISTTTVLRATAIADGFLSSPVTTYSYIFLEDVIRQPATIEGFPNGNRRSTGFVLKVPLDMEMDPAVVSAYSDEIISSMTSIPTMSLTTSLGDMFSPENGFYFDSGSDSASIEHRCSIEILDGSNPSNNEQIDVGVESHSAAVLKRSFRLNFRSTYGKKEWKTKLFQNHAPLNNDNASNKFNTLILRAGSNRCVSSVLQGLQICRKWHSNSRNLFFYFVMFRCSGPHNGIPMQRTTLSTSSTATPKLP
jgi:hypothetical protein